jgi:hypothetical protein
MLERGVAGNLDKAKRQGDPATFQAKATKIQQQAAQAVGLLEKNLAAAPPAAKTGLEQALKAASPGRNLILPAGHGQDPKLVPAPAK